MVDGGGTRTSPNTIAPCFSFRLWDQSKASRFRPAAYPVTAGRKLYPVSFTINQADWVGDMPSLGETSLEMASPLDGCPCCQGLFFLHFQAFRPCSPRFCAEAFCSWPASRRTPMQLAVLTSSKVSTRCFGARLWGVPSACSNLLAPRCGACWHGLNYALKIGSC